MGAGSGPDPAFGAVPEPGERRITIADVAARAGVSKSAVSFVFNGRGGLSQGTTERIVRAARDLGWRPSARARALSRRHLRSAGLVLRDETTAGGALVDFLRGVGSGLAETRAVLVVRVADSGGEEDEIHSAFARESQVDVVLLTGLRMGDGRPAMLSALGLPFVVADQVGDADERADGMRAAVRHLFAVGHRRIALVAGDSLVRSVRRQTEFAQESRMRSMDARVCRLPDPHPGSAAVATARLLSLETPPTAIVYETGLHAASGLDLARRRGVRVPEELSVLALEDGPVALATTPSLTTVRRDMEAWGFACGRLLADVGGGAPEEPSLPPAKLIVRGTTRPPRDPADRQGSC